MNVSEIIFNETFLKYFDKIPTKLKKKFFVKLKLFKQNPFHPSLKLHKLS